MYFAAGDLIPADGRLLEAKDFFVNQALLTGEPYPVEKKPGELPDEAEVLLVILLPFTPLRTFLGFVAPPLLFFVILAGMVVIYLLAVEMAKQWFYKRYSDF